MLTYTTKSKTVKHIQVTSIGYRLLDSLVVECWLRVREVPGSTPSPGPRHTKDVIKNGTRNPSKSGMKKPNDHAEPTKVERYRTLKIISIGLSGDLLFFEIEALQNF